MSRFVAYLKSLVSKNETYSKYSDISKDMTPKATEYRQAAPGSHKDYDFPMNFPRKTEALSKTYYHIHRRDITRQQAKHVIHGPYEKWLEQLNKMDPDELLFGDQPFPMYTVGHLNRDEVIVVGRLLEQEKHKGYTEGAKS